MRAYGVQAEVIVVDFEQPLAVQAVLEVASRYEVGLLVPAAGFGDSGLFVDSDLAHQMKMVQVNITSVMELTHHISRRMLQQKHGGIILIASLLAFHGTPYSANYAATKAYVQSLGEALGIELKGSGVDVLVSSPGPTDTGFVRRAHMQMGKAMTAQEVAADTLNALGHSGTVLPGMLTKLLRGALMTAPRYLQVRIIGNIMKGFAQKH
ncbi:MAG: short-chain dehydrogenase [Burkholderiales bacterium PBB4]|nr:MAG: short-chain dehydrogenase [Burkholderiales bacterium PBB4]